MTYKYVKIPIFYRLGVVACFCDPATWKPELVISDNHMQCKIENISSIIISTFLKFLISFNLINLLQERVISEIFMFL
jgi:hypothetical protein